MNAIITPTFTGHFCFIRSYLASFANYALDADKFDFVFVVEKESIKKFNKIIAPYNKKLNIKVIPFEDVLDKFNIKYTPNELLRKYGKFTYQTFKKMYTMLYADYERYLVLDSESMLVCPTEINKLFDDFFAHPFVSGTKIDFENRQNPDFNILFDNINFLLGYNSDVWLLENFVWFYETKILKDLFNKCGNLVSMADKLVKKNKSVNLAKDSKFGIFEICLYQNWLFNNRKKYKYDFKNIDAELDKIDEHIVKQYKDAFYGKCNGSCGLVEHVMLFLNKENVEPLANLIKNLRFNIIRCDVTTERNYKLQKTFLEIVKPNILAASQNHCFGIKHNQLFQVLFLQSNTVRRFLRHFKMVIAPITYMLKWVARLIFLPFDIILVFVKFIKIVLFYFKK